jgi:hypothetical protein
MIQKSGPAVQGIPAAERAALPCFICKVQIPNRLRIPVRVKLTGNLFD